MGRALLIVLLLGLVCAGCTAQPPSASTPPATLPVIPQSAVTDAIKFRVEFGLRADEPFVRSVFSNPVASSVPFGVPLLPPEIDLLTRRASLAAEVAALVREYGKTVPETYAGVYIEPISGVVYALFVDDIATARLALHANLNPLAKLQVLPAKRTLRQLNDLLAAISSSSAWFRSVGIILQEAEVNVENNVVDLHLTALPDRGAAVVAEHFDVDPSALALIVDADNGATLPRGSVVGSVVDASGAAVIGHNFDVEAVGDIGDAEPDGGVGIATDQTGMFRIAALAEMGWEISIKDPGTGIVLGRTHVVVVGGEITTVRVVLGP